MKGRPKKPTRSRTRTGNRRKPNEAPKLATVTNLPGRVIEAPPPDDLPEACKAMWEIIVGELAHRNLNPADLEAIRQLVTAAYRARQAAAEINRLGILVQGERGPMVNPLCKLERDATMTYLRLAEQYGLTIASRLRLGLMALAGETVLSALNEDLDAGR